MKGDCLAELKKVPSNSVDSVVTDPPYEIGLCGKSWDSSGIAFSVELWAECLRVLKPGGHLLAFGATRTSHRMISAIEDAGFSIRDSISWVYGQGMPKSHNVSIAIDKAAKAMGHRGKRVSVVGRRPGDTIENAKAMPAHVPITSDAAKWSGWGTALKPAVEPICVARKPLDGTVVANILKWGVGALNIDGSRVPGELVTINKLETWSGHGQKQRPKYASTTATEGRWPANLVHDGSEAVLADFPQSNGGAPPKKANAAPGARLNDGWKPDNHEVRTEMGSGSAARFFYCAKPSKREKNAGLDGLPKRGKVYNGQSDHSAGNAPGSVEERFTTRPAANFHESVKPLTLMRYLCKLVTPPGGVVLDPFLGSGTTAVAAVLEGFEWLGCELTPEYWSIIKRRVAWAEKEVAIKTGTLASLVSVA
jgi:site-specific DNA-methyltransferase (adenine-specific)